MLLDGLHPALYGLVIGLVMSIATSRMIQSMLYGAKPADPSVYLAVASILLLVAALACLVPAWQASRLDPVQSLRTE